MDFRSWKRSLARWTWRVGALSAPSPWVVGSLALGWLMILTGANGGENLYSMDARWMFVTARFIVETGSPDLADFFEETIAWGLPDLPFLHASPTGGIYAKYNLGQPLLAVPLLAVGWGIAQIAASGETAARLMAFFFFVLPALATAATAALLYAFARELWGAWPALGVTASWLLTTPAGPYGKYPFAESTIALGWTLAYFLIFRGRNRPELAAPYGFLSGVASGWTVWIREGSAVGLPAVLLYLWMRCPPGRPRWRALAAWGLGVALPILAAAGCNVLRFGHPLQSGYFEEIGWFAAPAGVGWWGLLASPGKGLLFYAPSVWLVLPCARRFWQTHRPEAAATALHALGYWALFGAWWSWHGGWAWGPRFLVPVLPLLWLGTGSAWQQRRGRLAALSLSALGLAVQIPGFAVDFQEYYIALLKTRGGSYEAELLFNPSFTPILGQWRMLLKGEHRSLTFFSLERTGIPSPVANAYRASALLLLAVGLFGWARRSPASLLLVRPIGRRPLGLGWAVGGGILLLFGLNARLWLTGVAQHSKGLCERRDCQPIGTAFANDVELLAWSPPPATARPGETLRMRLWWRAARPADEPLSVYVHFIRGDQLVFQSDHEHPAFLPLTRWVPGWIYPDPYAVRVPAEAPPGEYRIRIGLYRRHPPGGRIPTHSGEDGIWLPQAIQVISGPEHRRRRRQASPKAQGRSEGPSPRTQWDCEQSCLLLPS